MTKLANIILFSSTDSLDEIKAKLDQIPSWAISTYTHEHLIECYGVVAYERWGGSIFGDYNGAKLHFTIEGRNLDTGKTCYRLTFEYSEHIQEQFRMAPKDKKSTQRAVHPVDELVKALISRVNGVILDDQD